VEVTTLREAAHGVRALPRSRKPVSEPYHTFISQSTRTFTGCDACLPRRAARDRACLWPGLAPKGDWADRGSWPAAGFRL